MDIHFAQPDDPHSLALITRAYHEVYVPAFPVDGEREQLAEWVIELGTATRSREHPAVIVVAGSGLDNLEQAKIGGVAVAYYYPRGSFGYMAYNAVAPAYRSRGLGTLLLQKRIEALHAEAARHGRELETLFLEANGARLGPSRKQGFQAVPVNYIQPIQAADGRVIKHPGLTLMAQPLRGAAVSPTDLATFLDNLYRHCGVADPLTNSDFRAMMAELEGKTAVTG